MMLYTMMTNDSTKAQLSQNTLESIVNQANVSMSPQINVGDSPIRVSYLGNYSRTGDSVYVANLASDTVSIIDPATTTVKNILVGDGPGALEITPAPLRDYVYVANFYSDTVSVIDTLSNTVIKNIIVGDGPGALAISPSGASVYVANSNLYSNASDISIANDVSVIETLSNTVIKNITVGDGPLSIAISPLGDYVYVANAVSGTVSVIDTLSNTVIKNITVGEGALSIAISSLGDSVYVANYVTDTVSIIDPATTTIKNITVGDGPIYISYLGNTSRTGDSVYVANYLSGTVSIIDPATTTIKNITVGDGPNYISYLGTNRTKDSVYVANDVSDTVSVIDRATAAVENIPVGDGPVSIAISPLGDSLYVANFFSGTVSVIDTATNNVMAGVTFDSIPFRGGQIICNGLGVPINRYFYVSSGTECVVKPNNGYEFDSWVEILDGNSSRTINASTTSDWLLDPVGAFRDVFTDDPAATLTVNRFGNFTAYFKALPPPVPAEFTASLITVIIAALVGSLLIPAVVSWLRSKKQTSRLNSFHQQMAIVYGDGKVDESDISKLDKLNKNISDTYAAGKINNDQYTNLKNDVSAAYQKIFKKRIESITDPNTEAVNNIKNDIEDAYSDRKITELDYNLLNGKISRMFDK